MPHASSQGQTSGKERSKRSATASSHQLVSKGMGVFLWIVDHIDRLLESYPPCWPLFVNVLNITVVAAWRIHCQVGGQKITTLECRQVTYACSKFKNIVNHQAVSYAAELPHDIRFDGQNIFLWSTATQGRCKVCKKIQKVCAQNVTSISTGNVARPALKLITLTANKCVFPHKLGVYVTIAGKI